VEARFLEMEQFMVIDFVYIAIFFIDIIVNFFVEREIISAEQKIIVKDLKQIARIYLKRSFWFDLITILPLWQICYDKFPHYELILLIKCTRIIPGMKKISASNAIELLREISKHRVDKMISQNKPEAFDKTKNNTYIA
jgi:hypothetical protein